MPTGLSGGAGDDFVEASKDDVSCGAGLDMVEADGEDAVASDCERLNRLE